MPIPYPMIKILSGEEDPNIRTFPEEVKYPRDEALYLMQDGNMSGKYLGSCLDSCRWGSLMTVMYDLGVNELIGLVMNWKKQNDDNFQNLWHEKKINDLYKRFELPNIHYDKCPRDEKHNNMVKDLYGRKRCFHKTEMSFKPSFVTYIESFDDLSKSKKKDYFHQSVQDPVPDDA